MDKVYSVFIETMKMMYCNGKVDAKKIKTLLNTGKISVEEYEYIIREVRI